MPTNESNPDPHDPLERVIEYYEQPNGYPFDKNQKTIADFMTGFATGAHERFPRASEWLGDNVGSIATDAVLGARRYGQPVLERAVELIDRMDS